MIPPSFLSKWLITYFLIQMIQKSIWIWITTMWIDLIRIISYLVCSYLKISHKIDEVNGLIRLFVVTLVDFSKWSSVLHVCRKLSIHVFLLIFDANTCLLFASGHLVSLCVCQGWFSIEIENALESRRWKWNWCVKVPGKMEKEDEKEKFHFFFKPT